MIGLIEEVLRNKSSALAYLDDLKNRYVTFINRLDLLFSEGMTRGEFKEKDDGIMAVAFEGMLHMYFGHLNQIKDTERNRKDEADLLSIFMDGASTKQNLKTAE